MRLSLGREPLNQVGEACRRHPRCDVRAGVHATVMPNIRINMDPLARGLIMWALNVR